MEITLENKAKFFAQYIGNKFMADHCLTTLDIIRLDSDKPYGWIDTLGQRNYTSNGQLILKPISSINPYDIVRVPDSKGEYYTTTYSAFANGIGGFLNHLTPSNFDYLRSKGYALPWMGLSVEQMVEAGWVKLHES